MVKPNYKNARLTHVSILGPVLITLPARDIIVDDRIQPLTRANQKSVVWSYTFERKTKNFSAEEFICLISRFLRKPLSNILCWLVNIITTCL